MKRIRSALNRGQQVRTQNFSLGGGGADIEVIYNLFDFKNDVVKITL
jgi:hypothetical protein